MRNIEYGVGSGEGGKATPPSKRGEEGDGATYWEVSVDRNTATETQTLKYGWEGRKAGRKPKENDQKPRKPTETQGPCPDLLYVAQ